MNPAENAAIRKEWESWNATFPLFRLNGNIHYDGASNLIASLNLKISGKFSPF